MSDYVLNPIGYVRNPFRTEDEIPYQGGASILELLPDHQEAASGLEPGYIWVLTWLHQSERTPARHAGGRVRGSFASRTPVRLNPVGITVTRLLSREGARLSVDALDVIDGTPLLDVKPYVREFDCVFGPADPAWRRAPERKQRLARIVRTIERFCGPLTPELTRAADIALAADIDLDVAVNSPDLTWECCCSLGIAAGIQAVAGAPLHSPRFRLGPDEGLIRVSLPEGRRVEYRV